MCLKGAILDKDGRTYSVFLVSERAFVDPRRPPEMLQHLSRQFPYLPVCLMAKAADGTVMRHAKPGVITELGDLSPDELSWEDLEGRAW